MNKNAVFILFVFTVIPTLLKAESIIMEDDIESILVERIKIDKIDERRIGNSLIWDLRDVSGKSDPMSSYIYSSLITDSIFEVKYQGQQYCILKKEDRLYLTEVGNRTQSLVTDRDIPLTSRKALTKCDGLRFNYSMSGVWCGLDSLHQYGDVAIERGEPGIILLPGNKKVDAYVLVQTRHYYTVADKGIIIGEDDTSLVEKRRVWYSDDYIFPLMEERSVYSTIVPTPLVAECFILAQAVSPSIEFDDEDKEDDEVLMENLRTEMSGKEVKLSFFVGREGTDVDIVICNVSGIVLYTSTEYNLPVGEYSTSIPCAGWQHGNYLIILTTGDEYHKRIINI